MRRYGPFVFKLFFAYTYSMQISKIIFKSLDKEKLGQFLSHLFEMEFDHADHMVVLKHDQGIVFYLEDILEPIVEGNTVIDLAFDSTQELHDLMQKIHFLEYRGFSGILMTDLSSDGSGHYFEFTDFDRRIWRLSSKN